MIEPSANSRSLFARCVLLLLITMLSALLVSYEYLMLQWPMLREAHFLHYIGYLINEHGFVPYRDVLDTSWFGTFLFHMAIGKIFGYTSFDFRLADIASLCLLLVITWKILRTLDAWLAWLGTLSAGLAYLHLGPGNTLQRDYVLLIPITTSILIALQSRWTPSLRALLIGMCFGAAASIKPHSVIGLPVILVLLHSQPNTQASRSTLLFYCGLGGATLFSAGLLWLYWSGGLPYFIDMCLHYLPLYQSLNGAHETTTLAERWQNTLYWWKYYLWLWPYSVAAGLLYTLYNTEEGSPKRALALALVALAACYNLYPLLAGKFWDYHWIPYIFFSVLATSTLLLPPKKNSLKQRSLSAISLLFFLCVMSTQYLPESGNYEQIQRYPDIKIDQSFTDQVTTFIKQHLNKGEKIQIIDTGGLATLFLLRSEAVIATPYLEAYTLQHHTNSTYVQHAQQDFLQRLNTAPPQLFLVMSNFARPTGPNTIREIPGLKDFLNQHYSVIWQHKAFTIWQRNNGSFSKAVFPAAQPAMPDSAPANPP